MCELLALVVFKKIEISHLCNAQTTVGRLWHVNVSLIFWMKERNVKHLNHPFHKCKRFRDRLNRYREIVTRT